MKYNAHPAIKIGFGPEEGVTQRSQFWAPGKTKASSNLLTHNVMA